MGRPTEAKLANRIRMWSIVFIERASAYPNFLEELPASYLRETGPKDSSSLTPTKIAP